MSLPHATDEQIAEMQRVSDEQMKEEGTFVQDDQSQPDTEYSQEAEVEQEYEEPQPPVETQGAKNFRMVRERAERAERERDEIMRWAMNQNKQPEQKIVEPKEDYSDINLDDDALMEGKHAKRIQSQTKKTSKDLENLREEVKNEMSDLKLRYKYPDIDTVVNSDNIELLKSMNPELVEAIISMNDTYKKGKLAYESIKQYGIIKDKSYEYNKVLAQNNSAKPRPIASLSPQQSRSPLSNVNGFANAPDTQETKDKVWRDMLEHMKNL